MRRTLFYKYADNDKVLKPGIKAFNKELRVVRERDGQL
jgi:hypothetical protein